MNFSSINDKKKGSDPTSFIMNLECIGFCEWEFGQLKQKQLNFLGRFYLEGEKNGINEKTLDEMFNLYLLDMNKHFERDRKTDYGPLINKRIDPNEIKKLEMEFEKWKTM